MSLSAIAPTDQIIAAPGHTMWLSSLRVVDLAMPCRGTGPCPGSPEVKQAGQRFWSPTTSVGADRNLSRIASATFTRNSEVSLI